MIENLKKTVLLTGATGFMGSHLLAALLENSYNVIILKRTTSDISRISHLVTEIVSYDIDTISLDAIFEKGPIDIVIHAATVYGRGEPNEFDIIKTNLLFSVGLLRTALHHNVKVFVNTDTFFNSEQAPISYMQAYTLSKKQFVEWAKYFSENNIIVRNMKIHHLYGTNDNHDKFIPYLKKQLMGNTEEIKLTSGMQLRDFVYIDDAVNAYICVLNNIDPYIRYEEYVVCTGIKTSVKTFCEEMYSQIYRKYGTKSNLLFGAKPTDPNEIMDIDNDASSLISLGWAPNTNIQQGINKIIKKNES